MDERLTKDDVARLLADPSAESRALTANKISAQFGEEGLSPQERAIAEDIFRIMLKDAEVRVREALSKNLKECEALPHDVAWALARDVDTVACPILQFSKVLTDEDLLEIVRTQGEAKQEAVARRPVVSERVADALVGGGAPRAVAALASNDGARLSEFSLQRALDRFGEDEQVTSGLVQRGQLPITVAERLVTLVSEAMQDYLVTHHELSPAVASDLVLQSRERATVSLLSPDPDAMDVGRLVEQLHVNGRLTPTIVLRALCMGDIAFFEASLATLARLPIGNARMLIHDEGPLGLKAIYGKAMLPETLYPAVRTAVDVIRETDFDGGPNDRERYKCRVLERILTQFDHLGAIGQDEDVDYLIARLGRLNRPDAPRQEVRP